jgi:LysR family nitrogen assimilation transcriptional regulator
VLRDHPRIELRLLTAYSGHLQQWLDDGDLDLSLLYNLTSTPSLNVIPLVREQLWAAAPPGDGLRADEPISPAELATRRVVMPNAGHALHTLISGAARDAGVPGPGGPPPRSKPWRASRPTRSARPSTVDTGRPRGRTYHR